MERIRGVNIANGWVSRSAASKEKLLHQLKAMVEEWRSSQPPPNAGVSNIDGGPIFDQRLPTKLFWGPSAPSMISTGSFAMASTPTMSRMIQVQDFAR